MIATDFIKRRANEQRTAKKLNRRNKNNQKSKLVSPTQGLLFFM